VGQLRRPYSLQPVLAEPAAVTAVLGLPPVAVVDPVVVVATAIEAVGDEQGEPVAASPGIAGVFVAAFVVVWLVHWVT